MNYHYIDDQNKSVGPVSLETLRELIRAGSLKNDPMVVPVGGNEWQPLSTFTNKNTGIPSPNPAPAPAGFSSQASKVADLAKGVSKDALAALKIFATNPIGGLAVAYENLGPRRAMGAGIAYGMALALALTLDFYRIATAPVESSPGDFMTYTNSPGFAMYLKFFMVAIAPFVALAGLNAVARKVFKVPGGLGQDSFIAGAALLPLALVALAGFILGGSNAAVLITCLLGLLAICFTIFILFTGLTRIYKLSIKSAVFIVPAELILAWVASGIVMGIFSKN